MSTKTKKTVDESAAEMADYALGLLSKLPAKERKARILAMEKAAAKLPSSPPARGTRASSSTDAHADEYPLVARDRAR